ncbi:hypothetical protein HG536_0A03670 [Torulaspora globosa]|uniref:Dihydrofolate synthetase n=1 Tax=Torulaspora globosa TaxID=48254 RepID=A0A7G3ZAL3_9SACH|nr:uncharacterized protein HG536_0A03670 [Torulaspora globosa]QLL30549.1 hypothetical protein HG536_0A03670 [Torulaspora globosa]
MLQKNNSMNINLGLSRVSKLLNYLGNPHERLTVLHVAGTNGKGSVCSYLSSILQDSSNQVGKFTTPHLIEVTDSITINSKPISWSVYRNIRNNLETINNRHQLNCTEFELLTCTAFQYFRNVNCQWCVIEVGLGGRLDATNIIPGHRKVACGITKISLDHEAFLGNSLVKIAQEKAGIITKGVKYAIVDGSNEQTVIQTVEDKCREMDCQLTITDPDCGTTHIDTKSWGRLVFEKMPLNGHYQICNLRVALAIIDGIQQRKMANISIDAIIKRLQNVEWPGRLQNLNFCYDPIQKSTIPVLLDGAHNGSAAIELAKFLRNQFGDQPLTFIVSVTSGKDLQPLFGSLLRPHDRVIVTEYGRVDGMPWISPMAASELSLHIKENYTPKVEVQNDVVSCIMRGQQIRAPIVICGSLYLCGDVLRLHQENLGQ